MLSLETLCINSIVQIFDRFYIVFSSKDENFQEKLKFLQIRYSDELIRKLYKARKLTDKYFKLFLNEHLSFFDSEWLCNSITDKSMETIFRRIPNITVIHIYKGGDRLLANIAQFCPNVIKIDAQFSDVTDDGVKYLCENKTGVVPCPKLKVLLIEDAKVTREGAQSLIQNIPSLEIIDYPLLPAVLTEIHGEILFKSVEIRFYNLVQLNIKKCYKIFRRYDRSISNNNILKVCLTVCPKLESLACYILDEEDFNFFTNSHLKTLRLACMIKYSKINIDNLLKTNVWKLAHLKITDCIMSISVLGEHCPNLKVFVTNRVDFTVDNEDLKPNFESLTECWFRYIEPSSNKGICLLLSSASKLESILFKYCTLSLEMKTHILLWCGNPCAKKIMFNNISIPLEMEFLRNILLNCPSLMQMVLRDQDFDDWEPEIKPLWRILENLAKTLPNKPDILDFSHMSGYVIHMES